MNITILLSWKNDVQNIMNYSVRTDMLVRRLFLSRETEREIPLLVKYSNNEYQKTGDIEDFNEEWNSL